MISKILLYTYLFILLIIILLFNQLTSYLFKVNGIDLYTSVWNAGKVRWGLSIAFLLFSFGFALLSQMNIVKLNTIFFGKQKQYVDLGRDIDNSEYYYDINDPSKKVIKTSGNELNQSSWFFDSFHDLHVKTVLAYGGKPDQVYSHTSLHPKFMILGYILELLFLGITLLIAFTIIGAYIEITIDDLISIQGESSFVTALKWLRIEHSGLLSKMILCIGLLYTLWLILAIPASKKLMSSTEHTKISEILPLHIKEGATIIGIFENYSKHSSSTSNSTNKRPGEIGSTDQNRHINVLAKFENIYEVPIYLRFSLQDLEKNWEWLERWKNHKGQLMEFKILEGKRIWPLNLKEDPNQI